MVSIKPLGNAPAGTPMAVSLQSTSALTTGSWRTFRPQYVTRPSPCNLDCPAGTDVRAFLALAAEGDVADAWRTIRRHNPFPAICGRVCYHPCEANCNRGPLDGDVAIHAIERAIADEARDRRLAADPPASPRSARIGVVGAGPAGLSSAYHLARRGYAVTVFDEQPAAGGMLRYGIPAYRLPRAVLDAEIAMLARMGITFVHGIRVGAAAAAPDLSSFAAIFLAVGAQRSKGTHIAGDSLVGVRSGLDLLRDVNGGAAPALDGPTVIIGGGNTAIDTARVALRLGAAPTVVYRRDRPDMPAHPDEIAQAEAEGVRFIFHATPVRFIGRHGEVERLELQHMRAGAVDASGRACPEAIPGALSTLPASHVFMAIGEEVETEALHAFAIAVNGRFRADRWGRTKRPTVFAGGDAATGAGTVVEAIGSGRRSAEAIDAYLSGVDVVETRAAARVDHDDVNLFYFPRRERVRPPVRTLQPGGFDEVVGTLAWEQAVGEARRCLTCGLCTTCDNCYVFCPDAAIHPDRETGSYGIDYAHCKGCGICVTECPRGALSLVPEEQR